MYACLGQEPMTGRMIWTDGSGPWRILIGDADAQNPVTVVNLDAQPWGLSVVLDPPPLVDCNSNGIPDECEPDCNNNQVPDDCDIATAFSDDCNSNGTPDECEAND